MKSQSSFVRDLAIRGQWGRQLLLFKLNEEHKLVELTVASDSFKPIEDTLSKGKIEDVIEYLQECLIEIQK